MRHLFCLVVVSALLAAGCAAEDDLPAPTWRGNVAHVDVHGELDGAPVDVVIEENAAIDPDVVACTLAYAVPDPADRSTWAAARLTQVEVVVRAGQDELDLVFSGHDLAALRHGDDRQVDAEALGVTVAMRGRDARARGAEASTGRMVLGQLIGRRTTGGTVIPSGSGQFGAAFEIVLPGGGRLGGSLTARCAETILIQG